MEVWRGFVAAYMWTRGIGTATKPLCGIGSPGPLFRPDSRVRPRVHLHNGFIILRSTDSEVPLGATRVDAAGVARSGAGVDDR